MRVYLSFASLLVLSACAASPVQETPSTDDYQRISFEGEAATPQERARCEAAGGEVQRAGRLGWEACIQTFADAGDTCSDSSDCLGECRNTDEFVADGAPATGQCAVNDSPFGCHQTIENGIARPALCVD